LHLPGGKSSPGLSLPPDQRVVLSAAIEHGGEPVSPPLVLRDFEVFAVANVRRRGDPEYRRIW